MPKESSGKLGGSDSLGSMNGSIPFIEAKRRPSGRITRGAIKAIAVLGSGKSDRQSPGGERQLFQMSKKGKGGGEREAQKGQRRKS